VFPTARLGSYYMAFKARCWLYNYANRRVSNVFLYVLHSAFVALFIASAGTRNKSLMDIQIEPSSMQFSSVTHPRIFLTATNANVQIILLYHLTLTPIPSPASTLPNRRRSH
jgi:hypothetical protein